MLCLHFGLALSLQTQSVAALAPTARLPSFLLLHRSTGPALSLLQAPPTLSFPTRPRLRISREYFCPPCFPYGRQPLIRRGSQYLFCAPEGSSWSAFGIMAAVDIRDKVKPKAKRKEEPSSIFQRQRVDALLVDLRQKFPPKFVQQKSGEKPVPVDQTKKEAEPLPETVKSEEKESAKNVQQTVSTKGPPEKRMRLQ
ncbi:mediator complex subunit 6 [Cricetulus griseus]